MVYSGGVEVGFTNLTLAINGGTHTFTLGDPQNYLPAEQTVLVAGTSVAFPLPVYFALPISPTMPPGAAPVVTPPPVGPSP